MKKILFIILFLFLFIPVFVFGGGQHFDSLFKLENGTVKPKDNAWSLSVGTPAVTEGVEYKVWQKNITNDAGETIAGAYQTVEMSDETDGTEDTILRTYTLVDGTATLQQTLPTP